MALNRLTIDGYGQLELNNVSFPRDGRIEAQCGLAATFTKDAPAEVGMLLAVDKANKKVILPSATEKCPIALNYSTEKIYDQFNPGLKNFRMVYDANGEYFFPRMGYLAVGEVFTTNCLCYDTTDFTNDAALIVALKACATTAVYVAPSTLGAGQVKKALPESGLALQVVEATTMPDGQFAVKLQVVRA